MASNLEQRGAGFGVVHADAHDAIPGPCPHCPNFARCARKLLACESFAAFVRRENQWEIRPRVPLAETYRALYGWEAMSA
jgi:hypothetical protein